jgi:hypothetical protein
MLKTTNQPHLRLAFSRDEDFLDDERKYAQSTSGREVSHGTLPADSRSIFTASDSPQGRSPYATLRKWPSVVPQRLANADCSADSNVFRKSLSSMTTEYHHVVTKNATPIGAFTKWCTPGDNRPMKGKEKNELLAKIRRENLRRLVQRKYDGNISALARDYATHMGKDEARPGFFNEVLKGSRGFGLALATDVEAAVELQEGQLSLADSPLAMKTKQAQKLSDELRAADIDNQPAAIQEQIREAVQSVLEKNKTRRRASR